MFEVHLMFEKEHADLVKRLAERYQAWKYSQIDGDPVLGKRVFCYLTTHSTDFLKAKDVMDMMARLACDMDVRPLRSKIEIVVYDHRW